MSFLCKSKIDCTECEHFRYDYDYEGMCCFAEYDAAHDFRTPVEYKPFNDGWFHFFYCRNCGHKSFHKPDICPVCGRKVK